MLDELQAVAPSGRRAIEHLPAAASLDELRRYVRARRVAGEEVRLVLYEAGAPRSEHTRRVLTGRVLLRLASGADPGLLARRTGARVTAMPAWAPGSFILEATDGSDALQLAERLGGEAGVLGADPLLGRKPAKKWAPNDTLYSQQWHLRNIGQGGGTAGIDVNVTNVWDTYRGAGRMIAIVDDGLQTAHPDLSPNVNTAIDYDWNDGTPYDPNPDVDYDYHGSSCAGVAAARGNNSLGVSGAAPEATLVGLRLIAGWPDDQDESEAMAHSNALIHIKSNSWGPTDDGRTLEGPGTLTRAALSNGCTAGRGGRGVIYVWAGGNGLDADDNANYDGYANSVYTVAMGAVDDDGVQSWYSEPGACLVAVTPSSGGSTDIVTTDLTGEDGYNYTGAPGELSDKNYTKTFGGTSSATPLAAGVIALMLQANTNLGWRDVQEILIRSATKNDASDTDWATNSAGFHFNHNYGAGLVNARNAVTMAGTWTNLGPQVRHTATQTNLNQAIPDNSASGVTRYFTVSGTNLRVEHVTAAIDIKHPTRGQLAVTLTSPDGFQSRLAEQHTDFNDDYPNWTFTSVRHWGEEAQGTWAVTIADLKAGTTGTLRSVRLELLGTGCATASNQPPVLSPIGGPSGVISNLLQFTVTAADTVDGDPVRLWATNVPSWATFNAVTNPGAVTNTFSGTPPTSGTFTVYFFAGDKDGTNSETVGIDISDGSELDISGYRIDQFDSSQSYTLPADTAVQAGGYVVVGRNAAKAAFETFWGVTLGADVVYLNGGGTVPQINGGETYQFFDDLGGTVDGPSGRALSSGYTAQRIHATNDATLAGSWDHLADCNNTATPGSGAVGNGTAGLVITEYSDASGTGNYIYEFVELYYDSGGGAPPETPPVLDAIGDTEIQVSNLLQFAVTATATDGDAVTLSVSNAPVGATFDATNTYGTFRFTPDASQVGVHTTTFYAADNDGADGEEIRITVTAGGEPGSTNVLVSYDFDDGADFEAVPDYAAPRLAGNAMDTDDATYTNYAGNPGRAIADNGWTVAGHYFFFGVTVSNGYAMRIDGMLFDDQRSSSGPTTWRIRYSGDGYGADLGSGGTHASFDTNAPAMFLSGVTGSVTFRVFGENASLAGGTWRLDNVTLLGSVEVAGDSDGDGMPDAWETGHFGTLTNEAHGDFDADGFENYDEFGADTDPTDGGSVFQLAVSGSQTARGVAFQATNTRVYAVDYATGLVAGAAWSNLVGSISDTNGTVSVSDTNAFDVRFYRGRVGAP